MLNSEHYKFKKLNGLEKSIDGNKYYSIDLTFAAHMKYDKEWSEKYLEHEKNQDDAQANYDAAMKEIDRIYAEDAPYFIELAASVSKEYQENEKIYRTNVTDEEKKNINIRVREIEGISKDAAIKWVGVSKKINAVTEEYSKNSGREIFEGSKNIKFPFASLEYKIPGFFVRKDMKPAIPKGCGFGHQGIAGDIITEVLSNAGALRDLVTPGMLYEGISSSFTATLMMQKSENGWIFVR